MNVWTGALTLESGAQLHGLQLLDRSTNSQSDLSRESILSLRCFVNPALIPLHARSGPELELHAANPDTRAWLKDKLTGTIWLEEDELDRLQAIQCPVALLVRVDNNMRAKVPNTGTTDLLIHGVLSMTISFERPPTPPGSTPSESDDQILPVTKQELRIYATPVSASLIARAQSTSSPPDTDDTTHNDHSAHFLPDIYSPSPKRKRVATLFESVTQHHKRARRKGGEAVSQLMAHSLSHSSQQQLQALRVKRESEEPSLLQVGRIASQRARSLSIGGNLAGKAPDSRLDSTRPSSKRGQLRDLDSRKGTPNPFIDSTTTATLSLPPGSKVDFPTTPKDAGTVIAENKNTITRTILTCMRLYGFNRTTVTRSGTSSRPQTGTEPGYQDITPEERGPRMTADLGSNTDEDEFKAMYHATYRASTFALRKYLKESTAANEAALPTLPPSLEKAKAMTCIDEVLRLFCEGN
ncbi:uncharacterized protein BP01DRAFT_389531 [Aspergillus saccharolyticus JOP 1030-1]|uniref:Sld7 C-terminal domain-containing protein n=1 Tax=Aspergillus saccharolyticus JOP 1030-1 TaxID=1450539 RepID=A0A318ZL06_9EURO|nr:hypothetical protein BP01DRAFT_389531 [Aspergillus saccharolyticus JOP 1030-1]PYH48259.1 hypothetical protein BP01DRAFT_389531 [Aspergillus saccharolyticus JOP 1030-1]